MKSVLLHETDATQWSTVKILGDKILLFESHFLGGAANTERNCDALHYFSFEKTDTEFMVHNRKIILELPPRKYLSMASFNEEYLIGCRLKNTLIEVWDLKEAKIHNTKTDYRANLSWSCDAGNRSTVQCTSIEFEYPFAYIGKCNGRCDIWNVISNQRVKSLQHDNTGKNIFMLIKKILLLEGFLITLTQKGKVSVWDKKICLEAPRANSCPPLWTANSAIHGNIIFDLYVDHSRLVCLETNIKSGEYWLEVLDLWHCYQKKPLPTTKRKSSENSKLDKRRLCLYC